MDINNETSYLMHPADMGIIYGRSIFCFISMFCCLLLMLFISFLFFKLNLIYVKKRQEKKKKKKMINII